MMTNSDAGGAKGYKPRLRNIAASGEAETVNVGKLQEALAYAQSIIDTVREPILVLDGSLHVRTASRAFYRTFGVSPHETEGRYIYDLGNGQWDIPALRTLLEDVLPERTIITDFEVTHVFPTLGRRVMLVNARQLWTTDNDSPLLFVAIEDVTERKRLHDELVSSNEEMQRFAYTAAHDLRTPLNAALNLSQLLERRVDGKLDEQESFMLRTSIESMERLNKLMNDILLMSEMGNAPQQLRSISLEEPLQVAL